MNGSGESTTSGSNDISILSQKLFRKATPLFFGVEQIPVLSFPLYVYSETEITASAYSNISSWLFGQQNFQKLRIVQTDMADVYYNCFLTAPQTIRIGNEIRGFTTTVICDSPFAWKEPKTLSYTFAGYHTNISFFNESANSFYTYPTNMVIRANSFGGDVRITNTSDDSRISQLGISAYWPTSYPTLTPLFGNEVITLNCDSQLISSSSRSYPLQTFNQKWPRFIQGTNNLIIDGNIASLSFTYPVAFKAG